MQLSDERREARRVGTPGGEAFCHIKGFGSRYKMHDLSMSGCMLDSGPDIPLGTHIEVVLFAAGLGLASLPGRVARVSDGGMLAVRFETPISSSERKRLQDLVFCAQLDEV